MNQAMVSVMISVMVVEEFERNYLLMLMLIAADFLADVAL